MKLLELVGWEQHGPRILDRSSAAFEVEVIQNHRWQLVGLVRLQETIDIPLSVGQRHILGERRSCQQEQRKQAENVFHVLCHFVFRVVCHGEIATK